MNHDVLRGMIRLFAGMVCVASAAGATLHVPKDQPTIQAAIDAAKSGDTVQIAPGKYEERLKIGRKSITLASDFIATNDRNTITATMLVGGSTDGKKGTGAILTIERDAGPDTKVIGLTFFQGDHGILNRGRVHVSDCRFVQNRDGVSFESGAGVVRGNTFERNRDDGIDMDNASQGVIENNVITDSRDDGLELRLHKYETGPNLAIVIRANTFARNGGDGVQLIDYPGKSRRTIRIERNIFARNAMAGVGSMADGLTKQNFKGAELIEPVLLINNTFVDSNYGLTGGENMLLLNNVFLRTEKVVLAHVKGDSVAGNNLIWQSGTEFEDCDLDQDAFIRIDPQLDENHGPKSASPCIDGGVAKLSYNGEELTLPPSSFSGRLPDLGAVEIR